MTMEEVMPVMRIRQHILNLVGILLLLCYGCNEGPDLELTQDRSKLSLSGTFVTESPDEISFPVKVLFAIDCSLSMGDAAMGMADGSDPHYLRLEAVRNFVDQYNINENTSFEIMLWNLDVIDVTMAMGPGGQMIPGFTKDPDELNRVLDNAHVDSMTDYLGTLDAIYHDIEQDILNTEDEANLVRTKYIVVFLSDGMSNVGDGPQSDIEIWARVEDLYEMVTERGVGGLNFHTFLLTELFGPGPMDQYVQGLCETTLQGMSDRGNGQFRIFETAESIDFINIVDMRLTFEYKITYLVAYNYNVRAGVELVYVDSDGDGLCDDEEADHGTDPTVKDTDGDGLNDFFEIKVSSPGHELDPLVQDSLCNVYNMMPDGTWPDSDNDGLTDCEEFVKGTNRYVADTDGDGIPDGIEFLMGTNPLEAQEATDSDFDGVIDMVEVQKHSNVTSNDPTVRERYGYHYDIQDNGLVPIDQGTSMESYVRQYDFLISNIDIMDTMGYVKQDGEEWHAGDNLIRFYIAEVPEDRPDISPIFRMAEVVVNISDTNKEIILTPSDFTLIQ
jgi:hypothetical protein